MKPNWKDAPKWAKYVAQDESGDHYQINEVGSR